MVHVSFMIYHLGYSIRRLDAWLQTSSKWSSESSWSPG